ncbi:MAG: hypothetical protein GY933_20685 [Hyphomicrobiales bacterium]|nr:hypothetical protein [Hyphomicrobiales bacterium]
MSRPAQVAVLKSTRKPCVFRLGHIALVVTSIALSACASGGLDMLGVGTDKKVQTGSVSTGATPSTSEAWSDEITIRNAVTSANLSELDSQPLAWANVDTGSQGAITQIKEFERESVRCRKFVASRESFEGVSLYDGEACLQGNGIWQMRKFAPVVN